MDYKKKQRNFIRENSFVQKRTISIIGHDDPLNKYRGTIPKLDFIEARRKKGPLYDALIAELLEENCPISACHFKKLRIIEDTLINDSAIRRRMSSDRKTLISLTELATAAERATQRQDCLSIQTAFSVLLQIVNILDELTIEFNWLQRELYQIIANICDYYNMQPEHLSGEKMAKIYMKFADMLDRTSKGFSDFEKTVKYYQLALNLSRGETFIVGETQDLLHDHLAIKLGHYLLKYGAALASFDTPKAIEQADLAVRQIGELGTEKYKPLFCSALIKKAHFLKFDREYEKSLEAIMVLEKSIEGFHTTEYCKLKADLTMCKAECLYNSNKIEESYEKFAETLRLCRIYKMREPEAIALLYLAKIYLHPQNNFPRAKATFEEASRIFHELGMKKKASMAMFHHATVHAYETSQTLIKMIKATPKHYCARYNLMQWKMLKKPFWCGLQEKLIQQAKNPVHCLVYDDGEYEIPDGDLY